MGQKYLVDTNVIIDFAENKFQPKARKFVASLIDGELQLSVINKIELLSFSQVGNEIIELVNSASIIGLTDAIVNRTIIIRRLRKIKLPDAVIAATAIENNLQLVTRNIDDFQNIKALKVINPWE